MESKTNNPIEKSVGGKSIEKLRNKCVRKFNFCFKQKLTN